MATGISWAEETWNPVVGCTPVSPGCAKCYAATMARRLERFGRPQYQGLARPDGTWSGVVRPVPGALRLPYRWTRPRVVFVGSMTDLFHPEVPDSFLDRVWAVMEDTDHVWLVLTKRPWRMSAYVADRAAWRQKAPRGRSIWLGTSIETAGQLGRLAALAPALPTAGRFLSLEPLLGPLAGPLDDALEELWRGGRGLTPSPAGSVDWIIVGGESGAGARPMRPAWARDVRDLCMRRGIPMHFKQWGPRGRGRCLDGRAHDACPPELHRLEMEIEPPAHLRDPCIDCKALPAFRHHRCRGCLSRLRSTPEPQDANEHTLPGVR